MMSNQCCWEATTLLELCQLMCRMYDQYLLGHLLSASIRSAATDTVKTSVSGKTLEKVKDPCRLRMRMQLSHEYSLMPG